LVITIPGKGERKGFCSLITDCIPDLNNYDGGTQCFPLYYYEEDKAHQLSVFDAANEGQYICREAISDFILERCRKQYGVSVSLNNRITKEDIFYYVYGFLHSPNYRETFASDLKKMLPRLPLVEDVKDFWAFSKAGRKLAALHLNYELPFSPAGGGLRGWNLNNGVIDYSQPEKLEYDYANPMAAESPIHYNFPNYFKKYEVEKMRFPAKDKKDTIIYNKNITIINIPETAYQYIVNGKSAIEWIMERYQITTHKESGITNNPNDWSLETRKPRYILDLLLNVIHLSVKTVEIVEGLPEVMFEG
jgi:predicted helicase